MLLIKKINETGRLINAKEEIIDRKRDITTYEYTNKYLNKNLELIKNYKDSVLVLNKLDSSIFIKEDMSDIEDKIEEILKKRSRGYILKEQDFKYIVSFIEVKSSTLRNAWAVYSNEITRDIINSLNSLSNLFEDKTKAKELVLRLSGISNRWPIVEKDIEEFSILTREAQEIIESLNLTDDVQEFLRMIVNRTATIEDLTPEILQWIKKYNFNDKLMITFKQA